jgi:AcrR family transcriptional regulator
MSREISILYHSNALFLQNGYNHTTMRQIADAAGVSLGLATYHYKTKRHIASTILLRYMEYLKGRIATKAPPNGNLLIRSAATVHLFILFFLQEPMRQFYVECLAADIYMESIQGLGNEAMNEIAQAHQVDVAPDLLLLFDNYIPPTVEKILILEKEKGNFPGIDYDDIPAIVFSIAVERYVGKTEIEAATQEGRQLAYQILGQIPSVITATLFLEKKALPFSTYPPSLRQPMRF